MKLVTFDDFLDTYSKISQRGYAFFFSKFTLNKNSRAISAFDKTSQATSNWWIIPALHKRWNLMISGDENLEYKDYFMQKYFSEKRNLKLLSIGSGGCGHEIELASFPNFSEVVCLDINQQNLDSGASMAAEKKLQNMKFLCVDVNKYDLPDNYYDIVIFNDALHHFENIASFLKLKIKNCLNQNGHLIIHEFVGAKRMQFPKKQILAINKSLKLIDKKYRKRYKTNFYKNAYYGPGLLRMIIADPSECVDSESILPAIHANFRIVEEKNYGGNILMGSLKEISHHFMELDERKAAILDSLFQMEDSYLKENQSDFVFGIYKKLKIKKYRSFNLI